MHYMLKLYIFPHTIHQNSFMIPSGRFFTSVKHI